MRASRLAEWLQNAVREEGDFVVVTNNMEPLVEDHLEVREDECNDTDSDKFLYLGY